MTTPDPTARARAIMRDLAEVCRKNECEIMGVQAGVIIDGNYVRVESRDSLGNGAPWSAEVEWTEYDYSDPYSPFPDKRRIDVRIASTDPEEQAHRSSEPARRDDPAAVLRPFLDACIPAIGRIGIGEPSDPGDELVDVTVKARDVRRAFAYSQTPAARGASKELTR